MKNAAGTSRKSSVLNTVLTMMLILFVSLLAFCSGLYLGKQLTDSEYQLKALEGDFGKASKTAQSSHGAEEKSHGETAKSDHGAPSDVINDEDIEAMSEKFVSNEKSEENQPPAHGEKTREIASEKHGDHDEHAGAPAEKNAVHANSKPDLSAVHKAAARVANNAGPSEPSKAEPATPRVPNSLPKTVGTSADVQFTVQVASYPTLEAAKAKAKELEEKGFFSFPVEAQVNGKTWYRVSIGSFKTYKDATTYRSDFLKKTGLATAIVQKIQR